MVAKAKDTSDYDPWERAFQGHIGLEPLLRGLRKPEKAIRAYGLAIEYDAQSEVKEYILMQLRESIDSHETALAAHQHAHEVDAHRTVKEEIAAQLQEYSD